jgi:hypothetical protein
MRLYLLAPPEPPAPEPLEPPAPAPELPPPPAPPLELLSEPLPLLLAPPAPLPLLDGVEESLEVPPAALPGVLPVVAPPLALSFMHLSRSAPVRPTHLLLAAPELEVSEELDAPLEGELELCAMDAPATAKSAAAVAVLMSLIIPVSPS